MKNKDLTPTQIQKMRSKEVREYNEKYVFAPLRFIGWIIFWIMVYFLVFEG